MSSMLNGLLALAALVLTALSYWQYTRSGGNTMWLVLMIALLIAFLVFGGMFLTGRINRNDDIHITE